MKNKKIIFIVIAILLVVLLFVVFTFFKAGCSTGTIKIENINLDRAFFSHYSIEDESIKYLSNQGLTWYQYKIDTGEKTKISNEDILSPENIDYRPDGQNAVIYSSYPDYNIKHYNFSNNNIYDLSEYVNQVIWDSSKEKIYYTYNKIPGPDDTDDQYVFNINESDYSGKNWRTIKDLSKTDYVNATLYPSFDETYIYYMLTPINNEGGTLKRLHVNTKQDEIMTEENIIFSRILFSPDRTKIAFLSNEGKLVVQDIDNKDSEKIVYNESIDINSSVWTNDNNYIYVIKDLNTLLKINVKNGKNNTYNLNDENVGYTDLLDNSIISLGINKDNNFLYFTYNNYLYSIVLK